mmetsp:Transcript_49060/g.106255  ORF Transcript_49060/g.106255 Transcript_49060/m.106255 type:complete len:239 (-) Transcript_49060:322-1038(-)
MLSRRSGPSALMQKRRRTATSKLRRRNSCVLLLNRLANIATRWRRRRSGEGSTAGTCSTTRRNTATTRSSFVALATLGGSATPKLTTPTLIRSPTERRGRSNRPACRRWSTTCTRLRCAAPSGLADARLTRRATSRTSTSATRFTTRRSSALLTRTRRRSRLTSSAARPCETRRLCVRACLCVCARRRRGVHVAPRLRTRLRVGVWQHQAAVLGLCPPPSRRACAEPTSCNFGYRMSK